MKNLKKHNHTSTTTATPTSAERIKNPFLVIHNEIDKAMNGLYDLFEPKNFNLDQFINTKLLPSMDLVEDKDLYKIEVELPGMDEKDVKITVDNNVLTITGEKTVSSKNDKNTLILPTVRTIHFVPQKKHQKPAVQSKNR